MVGTNSIIPVDTPENEKSKEIENQVWKTQFSLKTSITKGILLIILVMVAPEKKFVTHSNDSYQEKHSKAAFFGEWVGNVATWRYVNLQSTFYKLKVFVLKFQYWSRSEY